MQYVRPLVPPGKRQAAQQASAQVHGIFRALRFEQRSLSVHLDGLSLRTNLERDIHRHIQARAHHQAGPHFLLETGLLDFERVVVVGWKLLQAVVACTVGRGPERTANRRAMRCNLNSGQCRAGAVGDLTVDVPVRRSLAGSIPRRGKEQHKKHCEKNHAGESASIS